MKSSILILLMAISIAACKKEDKTPPILQPAPRDSTNKPIFSVRTTYYGETESIDQCAFGWDQGKFNDSMILDVDINYNTYKFTGSGPFIFADTVFTGSTLGRYVYSKDSRTTYTYLIKGDSLYATCNARGPQCASSYQFSGQRMKL